MNASHLLWIEAGDRVRLKADHSATGVVDEVFEGIASVVWDISGCVGDGPVGDLEKYEDAPADEPRRVAVIDHQYHPGLGTGRLMASMAATAMVAAMASVDIFREEPIRNTHGGPDDERRAERHKRELASHNLKIDKAEEKRQRKAAKLRERGRL